MFVALSGFVRLFPFDTIYPLKFYYPEHFLIISRQPPPLCVQHKVYCADACKPFSGDAMPLIDETTTL